MKKIKMEYFCQDVITGNIENVKLVLKDKQINVERITPYLEWAILRSAKSGNMEIVKLLLADKRINPKGEIGIRLDFRYNISMAVVIFDDVICWVENDDIDSIKDDALREKYLLWLYRIGGEKHSQAVENLK